VDYTDETLVPDVHAHHAEITVGSPAYVYLRVRVRVAGGIEFGNVTVRPVEGIRTTPGTGSRLPWTHHQAPNPDVIRTTGLDDADKLRHHKTGNWRHEFISYAPSDPRGVYIGDFKPSYQRLKGQPMYLRVTLEATRPWRGHLAIQLPNASGSQTVAYIPLEADGTSVS
jgi:hypothetical protein